MPWCPNCDNEYKEGYTVCADCGTELIDDEAYEKLKNSVGEEEVSDNLEINEEILEMPEDDTINMYCELEEMEEKSSGKAVNSELYVKASDRAENYKSSAYALLLVGVLGLIFMILVMLGVLNITIAENVRIISYIVMSFMFIVFIVIGIRSFGEAKKYVELSAKEEKDTNEIHEWFINNYNKEIIDKAVFWTEDTDRSVEHDYFKRYDYIKQIINEKYEDIDPSFAEKLIEDLYTELYEY